VRNSFGKQVHYVVLQVKTITKHTFRMEWTSDGKYFAGAKYSGKAEAGKGIRRM
jgi:hypothetical protein